MPLVPADDLPSGLVPESDLPETGRKTPKQMRERGFFDDPRAQAPLKLLRDIDEGIYEAGGRVTDVGAKLGLPPEVSAGAGYLTNLGLNLSTLLTPGGEAKATSVPLKDVVKMETLREGRKLGLNVPPSAVGSGHVERGIESLGGKADIGREMSSRNREAIQVVARREAGIPENLPITEETLAQARERIAEPYRQISALSPKAAKALEDLKATRQESKVYWNHYNRQADPKSLAQARKLDAKAEALEGRISKYAGDLAPDLLPALREARIQLAKNYDIEKALNVGTGEIDARMIGRMVAGRGTKGVTGELGAVGKFAQAFPDFVQPKDVARDVSMLRPYLALGALGGGGALSEHYTGTPYGMALGALPFISPVARAVALSKLMQMEGPIAGRAGQRTLQSSLIPLSRIGKDDDAGSQP